jgi:hypothetical protein
VSVNTNLPKYGDLNHISRPPKGQTKTQWKRGFIYSKPAEVDRNRWPRRNMGQNSKGGLNIPSQQRLIENAVPAKMLAVFVTLPVSHKGKGWLKRITPANMKDVLVTHPVSQAGKTWLKLVA